MIPGLLLDTDVLIEYLWDRQPAIDWLERQQSVLLVSVITVAELHAGVRGSGEEQRLVRFLRALRPLPVTPAIAVRAGRLRQQYAGSHGLRLADALIAATAQEHEAVLVTFNRRHFPMLPDLKVPYPR